MDLSVVPWAESLRQPALEAFGPAPQWTVEKGRTIWREPTDGDRWSRTLVLCDGSAPVAVAGAFHSRLHGLHEWAYVEVAPGLRGRGLGTRALSELRRALPATARPLCGQAQPDTPGWRFATRQGFASIQRCRTLRVTVPTASKADDVSITNDVNDAVLRAWRDHYVAGHYWHPPSEVSLDVWRELMPQQVSVLTVTRDRIVGIAFMIPDDHGPRFAGGAVARDDPDAHGIAERLLTAAAGTTGGVLDVELDDWMSEVRAVVEALPHEVLDEGHTIAEPLIEVPNPNHSCLSGLVGPRAHDRLRWPDEGGAAEGFHLRAKP